MRTDTERLKALIAESKPGFGLPQPFYCDPELFLYEIERVFLRNWMLAGHISQLREVGSFILLEYGTESFIVVRNDVREISAFANLCRHRGSRICLEPRGTRENFRCPYHDWVYALDGRLIGARGMHKGFNTLHYGLKRLAVGLLHGFIFVNAAATVPEFGRICSDLNPIFEKHDLGSARVCDSRSWTINANWKLVIDNFDECYHCRSLHPEYSAVMAHALPEATGTATALEQFETEYSLWENRTSELGFPTGRSALKAGSSHWYGRYPLRQGMESQTLTGRRVAPFLGTFEISDGGASSCCVYPGSYVIASCDHAIMFQFLPIDARSTRAVISWLVSSDSLPRQHYDPDLLRQLWTITTEQDIAAINATQLGVESSAYSPGPYAVVEEYCTRFGQWYLGELQRTDATFGAEPQRLPEP
jgi:phenylpropionate dioxygenase-like ring-hydroxylating dioxygenase large terminal subunit